MSLVRDKYKHIQEDNFIFNNVFAISIAFPNPSQHINIKLHTKGKKQRRKNRN